MTFNDSSMQEILANLIYPYDPSKFLICIKYKHYPVLSWTRQGSLGILLQKFNTIIHNEWWWKPIKLILKPDSHEDIYIEVPLLEQSFTAVYINSEKWMIIDIEQAGKYASQNYLYTFCVIIFHN